MFRHAFDYIRTHKSLLFIIIPGFLLHMLVMMPSGTNMCLGNRCGIHFWGVNGFDGMWHLEIAAVAFKTIPFAVPTFSGATLTGYNVLMDYFLYLLSFIGVPPIVTLFKLIPPIWFAIYTATLIYLGKKIKNSALFVGTLLFFGYFAESFGYLLRLYHFGSIFAGSQSFALQSATSLLNTQFALTLPLIMIILIKIISKEFRFRDTIIVAAITAAVIALKFYGGVITVFFAGIFLFESYLKNRSVSEVIKQAFVIGVITTAAIFAVYNPLQASKTGSIFTVAPFSTVHATIEEKDMVYMPNLVNARYYLYEHGMSPRLLFIELLSTTLYIFFNFGTRIFGFLYFIFKVFKKKATRFDWYLMGGIIVAQSLTIILIQKGDWWNTVQFSYYGIFLSNIFIAELIFALIKKRNFITLVFTGVILLLTIPQNIPNVYSFTDTKKTLYIQTEELEALDKLKNMKDGVVFHSFPIKDRSAYPYLGYLESGYVAAFTGKPLYFGHVGPLNIIGIDTAKRMAKINSHDCTILQEVDYIYYVKKHDGKFLKSCKKIVKNNFEVAFENKLVKIYRKLLK